MRKIILIIFIGLTGYWANAQSSFSVSFPSTVDTTTGNGQIIAIMGTATNPSCCSSVTINMTVISQSLPYDWSLRLCTPSGCTSSTTTTFTLSPLQTDSVGVEFNTGIHDMANGSATIRFANANDTSDYVDQTFTLIYKPVTTSIEEIATQTEYLSQNYPNPFSHYTFIDYKLDESGALLVINNLAGKKIKEYPLTEKEGTIRIMENLQQGIYFYSIYRREKLLQTRKFIVQSIVN